MPDTTPIIYIMFVALAFVAVVWWKQGLMPWWFAFLVPFTTLFGLMQHRPERMMAGALVMAGIANACWPYRGIAYMERHQGRRGNAVFVRFFASPLGAIVYRLTGLAAIGIGIGMWSAPPRSFEASAPAPLAPYSSAYRQLMDSYFEQLGAAPEPQRDKEGYFSPEGVAKEIRDAAEITTNVARRFRLLTVPQEYQELQVATLSYLDAEAQKFQKWSEGLASSNEATRKRIQKEFSAPDADESKLQQALKRAGEDHEEFTMVLNEHFPVKPTTSWVPRVIRTPIPTGFRRAP
jgi:hypothetical protein